ncbi:MAG: dTDP-4-dehydrorhamnose 3,5-epimerase [Pseudomonadota bacterium]
MKIEQTSLAGVVVLTPPRFGDDRGFFSEVWNRRTLSEQGIERDFVQDNHSLSRPKGTLRGLHYQAPPHAQAKLVRCTRGAVWDVAVDARVGSPTFSHWFGVELSAENGCQILVPDGFLHGFVTLTEDAEVLYKCDNYYNRDADGAVLWDSLPIEWPIDGTPILSDKDRSAPPFDQWESPFKVDAQ